MRYDMNSFKVYLLMFAILVLAGMVLSTTRATTSPLVPIFSTGDIVYGGSLRHVDFETGDFSQVPPGDTNGDNGLNFPTIVTDRVHSGTYAARCNLDNPNVCRASEIRMWGWSPQTLPPLYYSFWIYVQDGYEVVGSGSWQMICEWMGPQPAISGEILALSFEDAYGVKNNLFLDFKKIDSIWGVPGADPALGHTMMFSGVEMPTGEWVFFEIYCATDMTNGIVQVKMNGAVILEWLGRTQFDPVDGTTDISFCTVNYCAYTVPPHSFWFDDIWIDYVSHS